MFASFLRPGTPRGTMILEAARPEGPYVPVTGVPYTPGDWSCLDGTFFEEDGKFYSFFIHEWTQISDGTVELARLKDDFSGMASDPVTLFHGSDAPWARAMWNGGFVTDGPFLWRLSTGRLAMLWSGFGTEGYTLGVAYSDGGVRGPWVQDPEPLFPTDGGHGMIFRTPEGKLMLSLHSPNETPKERPHFFLLEERDGRLCRACPGPLQDHTKPGPLAVRALPACQKSADDPIVGGDASSPRQQSAGAASLFGEYGTFRDRADEGIGPYEMYFDSLPRPQK